VLHLLILYLYLILLIQGELRKSFKLINILNKYIHCTLLGLTLEKKKVNLNYDKHLVAMNKTIIIM